ncbi:MAG: flagellar hook-length control protein FliK [Aquimonas sp.]
MNPSTVTATASGIGSTRHPAPRSESGSGGSLSFTELLVGTELPAEPVPLPRAVEPTVEAQMAGDNQASTPVAEASLLAALGLMPLPLEPSAGDGWSAPAGAAPAGSAVNTLPAAGAAGQAVAALAAASPSALAPTTDLAPNATSNAIAIAIAGSTSDATRAAGLLALESPVSAAPPHVQPATPTAAQPTATAVQAGSAALPANFSSKAGVASIAAPLRKAAESDTATLERARLAALTNEAASIRLTSVGLRTSPRPAADFSTVPLPGQPSAGAATTSSLALTPTAAPDAHALSLAGADSEPASSVRRVAGETGFLLPTAPDGLERAELTATPRESLASLPPLLAGARLDPTTAQFSVALGQQMQWMANQQVGRAELRLDPEELGPLEIRLEMQGDEIRAEFSSRSAEVRSLLETQVPRLRELLAEQGFSLADAQVGQERAAYQDAPQQRESFSALEDKSNPPQVDVAEPSHAAPVRLRQGLIDDFA